MSILIKNGRVLDPANRVDETQDILIDNGVIAKTGTNLGDADTVIDAQGKLVLPGFVDLHVHLREPGQEYKEDIESGTKAAAAGGFTTVCCMPNTDPANDTRAFTEQIVKRAKEVGLVNVHPVAAITRGLQGETLCEYADLKDAGAVAVSDDGVCVMDSALMRHALEYAATFDLPVVQHCEDHHLTHDTVINEGPVSTATGLPGQPAQAESSIVARDIELVELTGARYHVAHVSVKRSLDFIREAKAKGLKVSCEVTPHHFTLADESCSEYDSKTKVNPPLRRPSDIDAIKEAIKDGTIDAIATDHAPHSVIEKDVEFQLAAFGVVGLETALPLCLDLWRADVTDLNHLVAMLTVNPAKAFGIQRGTLSEGSVADLVVVDPELEWEVDPKKFFSKGKNTPFGGRKMTGAVTHTVVSGQVVFERAKDLA